MHIDFTNCCDVESRILWNENTGNVLKIKPSNLLINSNDFSSFILSLFDNGKEISFGENIFDLYVFGLVENP